MIREQKKPYGLYFEDIAGGFTLTLRNMPQAFQIMPLMVWKVYPDLSHAKDWEAAIEATSFVPDDVVAEVCDALGLAGTPQYCAERIVEMTKLGARNLVPENPAAERIDQRNAIFQN